MGQSTIGSGTGAITQAGNVGSGAYNFTGGDTNQQQQGGSLNLAGAGLVGGSGLNALTSTSGDISVVQESPQAINALLSGVGASLDLVRANSAQGFALATNLGQNALDDARAALQPMDQRIYTFLEVVAAIAAVALVVWYFYKKG